MYTGGGKHLNFAESSADFCSSHYQVSPTPYVLPTKSYFSSARSPLFTGGLGAKPEAVNSLDSERVSKALTSTARLEAAMLELQHQTLSGFQLSSGCAMDATHTAVAGSMLPASTLKKQKSPRGFGIDGRASLGTPTLEVERSESFSRALLDNAVSSRSEHTLLKEDRWVLLAGYQSSLLGQLFRRFETMSACNTAMGGTFDPTYKPNAGSDSSPHLASSPLVVTDSAGASVQHNSSLWESSLKKYYRPGVMIIFFGYQTFDDIIFYLLLGPMWEDYIEPKERKVPFLGMNFNFASSIKLIVLFHCDQPVRPPLLQKFPTRGSKRGYLTEDSIPVTTTATNFSFLLPKYFILICFAEFIKCGCMFALATGIPTARVVRPTQRRRVGLSSYSSGKCFRLFYV